MKTYISEQNFVENFSKDVKVESQFEVNGKEFSAEYIGKNSGQQAVYKVTLDGNTKEMNITQLKKRLGVTYTREQNRTGETKTQTRFVEKTDEELKATAKQIADKVCNALDVIDNIGSKYNIRTDVLVNGGYKDNDDWIEIDAILFHILKDRQEKALKERQDREMKAAKEKAAKQAETIKQLLAQGMDKDELRALLGL